MWRWTAIIAALFVYLPARMMVTNMVSTTTAASAMVVNTVPLFFALIIVGIVVFAIK